MIDQSSRMKFLEAKILSPVVVQGIGYIALAFVILSFQQKKRLSILATMLVGVALFAVHYSLLHAWTGSLLNLLEASVVFVAFKKETEAWARNIVWPYIFSLLFL